MIYEYAYGFFRLNGIRMIFLNEEDKQVFRSTCRLLCRDGVDVESCVALTQN